MSAEIGATISAHRRQGAIAQLGERLLCKQEVAGSIPAGSTSFHRPMHGDARDDASSRKSQKAVSVRIALCNSSA